MFFRTGRGGTANLIATEPLPNPPPKGKPTDPPQARGGGAKRNAVPLYAIPNVHVSNRILRDRPDRTSALRAPGGYANVYAIELLMDELAARAGEDPVAYRLSILMSEPRARRLVERVAELADWTSRGAGASGKGLGMAFARYKNRAAYAAVAASVTVEETVRVDRVWCVADAGLVVNPDGARNQLEGGVIQALSWTLKEQVRFDDHGIASIDWDGYPDPALQRGAGDPRRAGRRRRQSVARRRRMLGRPDRGGRRQCRGARAGRPHPRHAAHPRADSGGAG